MPAILNIDPEAARDLEDNFAHVLDRALGGDHRRARDLARQLVGRLDLCGYRIGREDLHQAEEERAIDFEDEDGKWTDHQAIDDLATRPMLLDRASMANDA